MTSILESSPPRAGERYEARIGRALDLMSKRRQGKTCFNFKKPDPTLFQELEALTEAAATAVGK